MTIPEMVAARLPLSEILKDVRLAVVQTALQMEHGHSLRAAARLGVHRNTISRVLADNGLQQIVGTKPQTGERSVPHEA